MVCGTFDRLSRLETALPLQENFPWLDPQWVNVTTLPKSSVLYDFDMMHILRYNLIFR